jgi:hypothetical protein
VNLYQDRLIGQRLHDWEQYRISDNDFPKVLKTAVIAAPNICFRDVMAAAQNSLRYASAVDFYTICSDIDELHLEAS